MPNLTVRIKRLDPTAKLPQRATNGSLCYDLYALDDGTPHPSDDHAVHYRTGLAFECDPGWGFKIHSRSGHGFKSALRLSNSTGLIDNDYRGEVMVSIRFDASGTHRAKKLRAGDCIAQIEFVRQVDAEFIVVDELDATERGAGGFGSTDAPRLDRPCRNQLINNGEMAIPKSCPRCGLSRECAAGVALP
jgi:dUTP pyrophosphatase